MPTITIEEGNTTTGKLKLSPGDNLKVNKGVSIIWKIGDNSGVDSIVIKTKSGADIFRVLPRPQGLDGDWMGVVKPDARDNAIYNYGIVWKSTSGTGPHLYDPTIAIRPSTGPGALLLMVISLISAVFSFFTLQFMLHKRSKRNDRL